MHEIFSKARHEEEYMKWRRNHPDGWIVKLKGPKSMLHAPDCSHFDPYKKPGYILTNNAKMCFPTEADLRKREERNPHPKLLICSDCSPCESTT